MFKAISRLMSAGSKSAVKVTPRRPASRNSLSPRPPSGGRGPGKTEFFCKQILVPQSAFDAWPADPNPLVGAVVDFVNALINHGRFKRDELPPAAMQAYHCDYYLAQVLNGGHAQFVHNARATRDLTISDALTALKHMDATPYLVLVEALQKWVQDNPEEAAQQTGFEGGIAPEMAQLDSPFFKLNRKDPLRAKIAEWLGHHPGLRVVPDAALSDEIAKVIASHPDRARREAILSCTALSAVFTDHLRMGVGLGVGRVPPYDLLLGIKNGAYHEVDGRQEMAFYLETLDGPRWAVLRDGIGIAIHDCRSFDNSHIPQNPYDATMEDIQAYRPAEVADKLSDASMQDIQAVMDMAAQVKAGPAMHLLMSRLGKNTTGVPLTISAVGAIGRRKSGLAVTAPVGQEFLLFQFTAKEAQVTDLKTKHIVAQVTFREVAQHEKAMDPSHLL